MFRLPPGEIIDGVYTGRRIGIGGLGRFGPIANDLAEFLGLLRDAVATFADIGGITDL